MNKFTFLLISYIFFVSCNKNEVKGIQIWNTLNDDLSYFENSKLENLIEKALNKDSKAYSELSKFNCDNASCYDLGFIITQIIYRIGENEYIKITTKLSKEDNRNLINLIRAGLDQGDNNYDGKIDYKSIEEEFPKLAKKFLK